MNYAITGSSGFIGSALRERLLIQGHRVYPVKRYMMFNSEGLKHFLDNEGVHAIFHLAAYGNHYNQTDHAMMVKTNVLHTLNLFKAATGRPVYNFSTSSVTLKKKTLYSVTKAMTEHMSDLFENIINIRPYSVYGPGEAVHRFIPVVIQALKTGEQITLDERATHDWVYIDSFIDALLNGHTEIGSGIKYTNLEIVKELENISGKKLNYVQGKVREYDNDNWVCSYNTPGLSIQEGLLKTLVYENNKTDQRT